MRDISLSRFYLSERRKSIKLNNFIFGFFSIKHHLGRLGMPCSWIDWIRQKKEINNRSRQIWDKNFKIIKSYRKLFELIFKSDFLHYFTPGMKLHFFFSFRSQSVQKAVSSEHWAYIRLHSNVIKFDNERKQHDFMSFRIDEK